MHACVAVVLLCLSGMTTQAQTYFANGTAKHTGGDCYQLTNSVNWQNGSVWYSDKIDLKNDFDLEFYMNFGSQDQGADGIVFVLQDKGNKALGQAGGGLGYEGFSPSFGIEFDDYQNTNINDPPEDHIAVFRDGNISHSSIKALHKAVSATPSGANIEDGKNHLVRIVWVAKTQLLEVYFDCDKRISMNYDIRQRIFNGKNEVYWGFTAATGGLNNRQTVCLRKDILTADTVEVCKGGQVKLNSRKSADNTYNWLPATDLNDSKIKQPICSSIVPRTYVVSFKDLCNNLVFDTVDVVIHTPFVMDEVQDSLLCDGRLYYVNLKNKYDSVFWTDRYRNMERWLRDSGYYKFRAWKGVCWDDDSVQISTDVMPRVSIVGDSVFCEGEDVTLKADINSKNALLKWHTNSSDSVLTVLNSQIVKIYASNRCGEDSASFKVREVVLPQIEIFGDTIYCDGDSVQLEVRNVNGHLPSWSDGYVGAFRNAADGKWLAQIEEHHCVNKDSIQIGVRPQPIAHVPDIPLLCEFEELILTSDQEKTNRLWSNGFTGSTADYTLESGLHWLKTYNACGSDSVSFNIERKECRCAMTVPTAFTPNFDQTNEQFEVFSECDKLQSYRLNIYNRWGELLFTTTEIDQKWDGKYKGEQVQPGVYAWQLEFIGIDGRNPIRRTQSGVLHVLR